MIQLIPLEDVVDDQLIDTYFDITIIIDKDNNAQLIDNSQVDYKDFVDCNTLKVTHLKISI